MASNLFSAQEAIKFTSLAPLKIASPFIAPYLQTGTNEIKAAAAAPLAYNPSYTAQLRTMALDRELPTVVRTAPLQGLAVTDKEFVTYGLALAKDNDLPASLSETALSSVQLSAKKFDISRDTILVVTKELQAPGVTVPSPVFREQLKSLQKLGEPG